MKRMTITGISILLLVILAGCSTVEPFDQKRNCSDRALSELDKDKAKNVDLSNVSPDIAKEAVLIQDYLKAHTPEFQSCYQDYVEQEKNQSINYNICTVTTIEHGKITFLDIADGVNGINIELKKCLEKKFNGLDFGFVKNKKSLRIMQPLAFHARRL